MCTAQQNDSSLCKRLFIPPYFCIEASQTSVAAFQFVMLLWQQSTWAEKSTWQRWKKVKATGKALVTKLSTPGATIRTEIWLPAFCSPQLQLNVSDISSTHFLQVFRCVCHRIIMKVRSCKRSGGTGAVRRNHPALPACYSLSLKTTPTYELHLHQRFLCVSTMVSISRCG